MSHDHGSTDTTSTTSGHAMMTPYFHFTPGDYLFFKGWTPTSPGAIAGACIGLFLLAVLERWVTAMRIVFDHHWKNRALLLSARYSPSSKDRPESLASEKKAFVKDALETSTTEGGSSAHVPSVIPRLRPRSVPPFVASQDIPRGILHAFQSLLSFLLMLAAMTFRVEFILCIVAGLGFGETLFGRLSNGHLH